MRGGLTLVIVCLSLGACSSGVEGTWIGGMDCEQVPFDLELTIEHDAKLDYVGTGTQHREFVRDDRSRQVNHLEFDVALTLDSPKGEQALTTELSCTSEETLEYLPGRTEADVVDSGCEPDRYADYVLAWDGEDELTVTGPDGCDGKLTRR